MKTELKPKIRLLQNAVISRLCSVVFFIIFIILLIVFSITQYWIIHWILFGRTIYKDLWFIVDKYRLNDL